MLQALKHHPPWFRSQAWSEMSSTPASLIATLDAKTALLEVVLGMAGRGTNGLTWKNGG